MIRITEILILAAAVITAVISVPTDDACSAEELLARITVESKNVYVGEPFMMRVTVIGSTDTERPDLSALRNFEVKFQGGSNNSSHSVSIINGKVARDVRREYIYNYILTPLKSGTLTIPSVRVRAGGKILTSNSVSINASEPEETEDFKLRIRLSGRECYVGEPVLLNVKWYLKRDVRNFEFTAPFLNTEDFIIEEPDVKTDDRKQYFRVPISGYEFIAEKGRDTLAARQYATLDFSVALIPQKAGIFTIPEFIVACETGSSVRDRFFNDFFADGFSSARERSRKYVIPSNTPTLKVKPLPAEGKPADFRGHIGRYTITTSAEPLEVSVGDPITLEITLEGAEYLDNVELPPLSEMADFSENFKIPEERASGRVVDGRKIFTQTIRPVRADLSEIPPVKIVSFDTGSGTYRTVRSRAIPLTVNPTRIVRASDAEGESMAGQISALESWKDGIAYNYEGGSILAKRDYGLRSVMSRWWNIVIILAPPAFFILLLAGRAVSRKRSSDPAGRKARKAFKVLRGKLSEIRKEQPEEAAACGRILDAFKEYISCRLCRRTSSMTTHEIREELRKRNIEEDIINELGGIIEVCEAGTYAGESPGGSPGSGTITDELQKLIRKIDRRL